VRVVVVAMALAAIALAAVAAQAGALPSYANRCALCHQPDGRGIPDVYPPLAGTAGAYAGVNGGRRYLLQVVINGLAGTIRDIHGRTYSGLMPAERDLSDGELAAALNFAIEDLKPRDLPRGFKPITPAEVKDARATRTTMRQRLAERAAVLAEVATASAARRAGSR
jgi:cytochrome c551/c552